MLGFSKVVLALYTLSSPVESVQLVSGRSSLEGSSLEVIPSFDLSGLAPVQDALNEMQNLLVGVNTSAYDMGAQAVAIINGFSSTLVTMQTAVNAASRSPIRIVPDNVLAKATDFINMANNTIISSRQKALSSLDEISSRLNNAWSSLEGEVELIIEKFNVSIQEVESLVENSTLTVGENSSAGMSGEDPNSTMFIQRLSALVHRAASQENIRSVPTRMDQLDESLFWKHKNHQQESVPSDNSCDAAKTAITNANTTVGPFVETILDANKTLVAMLLSNLDSITAGVKQLNTSLAPALATAASVGIPSAMLSPFSSKLKLALSTVDVLVTMVKGRITTIGTTVATVLSKVDSAFAYSDLMVAALQEACLAGVCGATARAQCQGAERSM